jgi:hypothetical protein
MQCKGEKKTCQKGFQIGQKNIGDVTVLVDVPKKINFFSGTQEIQHCAFFVGTERVNQDFATVTCTNKVLELSAVHGCQVKCIKKNFSFFQCTISGNDRLRKAISSERLVSSWRCW